MRLCRVERLLSISRPRLTSPLFLISRQKGARLPNCALPRRQAQEVHRGVLRLKFHRHPGEPLREQRIARAAAVAAAATAAGACARSSFSRVSLARARRRRTVARRAEIGRGGRNGRGLVPHPALTRSASPPRAATTRAVAPARRPTASLTRRSDGAPTTKQTHSPPQGRVGDGRQAQVRDAEDGLGAEEHDEPVPHAARRRALGLRRRGAPDRGTTPPRTNAHTHTHMRTRFKAERAEQNAPRARGGFEGAVARNNRKTCLRTGVQFKRVERDPRADGGPCCRLCVVRDGDFGPTI